MKKLVKETSERLPWFRDVTRDSRFDIAFQPIVSLRTRTIHYFEALARFDGKIEESPYDAIAFAENAGVITDFDLAMAARVLEWLAENDDEEAVIAVNVSGRSVANAAFVGALHGLLNQYDAIRSRIMFEVTESARIEDLRQANEVIQGLRAVGHKVCLDDFGAGSAALRYLHALDVDTVKIDGQYVRSAQARSRNRKFLKAVAGLCRDLGIATIAEMVENEDTAVMLAESNVDCGQGYKFGKPDFDINSFGLPRNETVSARESRPRRRIPNVWA